MLEKMQHVEVGTTPQGGRVWGVFVYIYILEEVYCLWLLNTLSYLYIPWWTLEIQENLKKSRKGWEWRGSQMFCIGQCLEGRRRSYKDHRRAEVKSSKWSPESCSQATSTGTKRQPRRRKWSWMFLLKYKPKTGWADSKPRLPVTRSKAVCQCVQVLALSASYIYLYINSSISTGPGS